MKSFALTQSQSDILESLRGLAAQLGWKGEAAVVEGTLVYQCPLPQDPDVSGALFAVDPEELNIRLYVMLPLKVPRERLGEATEFVLRSGYGRRFGALEFDWEHQAFACAWTRTQPTTPSRTLPPDWSTGPWPLRARCHPGGGRCAGRPRRPTRESPRHEPAIGAGLARAHRVGRAERPFFGRPSLPRRRRLAFARTTRGWRAFCRAKSRARKNSRS